MRRALLASLLILAATGAASSYVLNASWATHSVNFYVNPANADVSQSAAITALKTAAAVWSLQSNADVQLYYMGTTTGTSAIKNGKNEVFFRKSSNGSMIGSTYYWYDGSGHLIDGDIAFYDSGIHFYTGASGCTGSYATYIEDAAAHEFGHMVGLKHTTDSTATMYPTTLWCSQNWRTLALDDQRGIEKLYPAASTITKPAAPTTLAASSTSTAVSLSWADKSTNESGFYVERSSDGVTFSVRGQVGANVTKYTDAVSSSTKYYYRARAYNSAGSSAYSNVISLITAAVTATTTTTTTVVITLSGTASKVQGTRYSSLSWKGATSTNVDVYRNSSRVAVVANSGTYKDNLGSGGSGTFTYKICQAGTSTCSNTISLKF